jgi:hypothetical protein
MAGLVDSGIANGMAVVAAESSPVTSSTSTFKMSTRIPDPALMSSAGVEVWK